MVKYAIATHGEMAIGLQSTLELFLPNADITYITAYTKNSQDLEISIKEFIDYVSEEEAVIFTDILGGSVNQKIILSTAKKSNFTVITGFNLALLLDVLTKNTIDLKELTLSIEESKKGMQIIKIDDLLEEDAFF